jgi:benzoyl-CoA reductase/2-hydroxyglutaryl-CoA dehydratase subunit BcrC/BadD/HgdB
LKAAPVALAGGPLLPLHYEIFEVVEAAGGWIALDATRAGEGSLAPPFDERRLDHDPLPVLVKAYFDGLLDAFRRPNEPFYHWFKAKVLERGIRGILLRHHMWCDLWRAEEQRLREVTGLPVLRLQVGEESQPLPHTINRVQSFLEMLR